MQFIVKAYDGEGMLDKRMEVRPRHLEGIERIKEHVICAGGLLDDEGKMKGSVLIIGTYNKKGIAINDTPSSRNFRTFSRSSRKIRSVSMRLLSSSGSTAMSSATEADLQISSSFEEEKKSMKRSVSLSLAGLVADSSQRLI